jgi:hypothetical protein
MSNSTPVTRGSNYENIYVAEIERLNLQLKKAEQVIEFYAKPNNWQDFSHDIDRERQGYGAAIVRKDTVEHIMTDEYSNGEIVNWVFKSGGKLAREYFKNKESKND